ncbi:SDR family NAD(P)-dependent oxidoreductase [Candidatus Kaiserbacteria bacterium]|nr:SDR family NAD(P)-dependent oxidoreductase [Candidatus Kaiserbacteria bacterium]
MKTILITGASSGIGEACARKFSTENYRLILCSRSLENLQRIKSELSNSSNEIFTYRVDVTNFEDVNKMFNSIEEMSLAPDVLINSAGLALGLENLEDGNALDWETMIDTNVTGLLYITKGALRIMKERDSGHIVNIGSIAGVNTYKKGIVYAATKSAVKSISDGLRKEVVEHRIKITNIQPGLVETNFSKVRFKGDNKSADSVYEGIEPLTATDVADIVAFSINSPNHVQINEVTVTPVHQANVEHIYRNNK